MQALTVTERFAKRQIYEEWADARCCGCKLGFSMKEWQDETKIHALHEPGCPNFGKGHGQETVPCYCNLYAHATCCPECGFLDKLKGEPNDGNVSTE